MARNSCLSEGNTMKIPKIISRLTGNSSPGDRGHMEDFISVAYNAVAEGKLQKEDLQHQYFYLGVFDGHGGCEAAKYAKEKLESNITNQRGFWSKREKDVLKAIHDGFLKTHTEMWKQQEKWPKTSAGFPSTAGTTASIVFIKNGKMYVGHVGDSKIVLAEQNGSQWKGTSLTTDHKPDSPKEHSRIVASGGKVMSKFGVPRVVWNRPKSAQLESRKLRSTKTDEIPFLAIARSLGDLWSFNAANGKFVVSPEPDVSVYELDPTRHKALVLASDGLWNVMSPQTAINIVKDIVDNNRNIHPSTVLMREALERWSNNDKRADNVSVLTLIFSPDDQSDEEEDEEMEDIQFLQESHPHFGEEPLQRVSWDAEDDEDFENRLHYQDISHMAVDEPCDALAEVKRNPSNAFFPKCVNISST